MSGWDEFVHWAGRLLRDIDLDETERNYKVTLAERLGAVREKALANEPEWPEELRRSLGTTNLLDRYFLMALADDLRASSGQVKEILLAFWSKDPSLDSLDELAGALRPLNKRYSAGTVLSLGAVLLMAQDAAAYPPFRAQPTQKWYRLTGFAPSPSGGSVSTRYRDLLNFCDELLRQSGAAELPIADRLDAQGLAWVVTEHPVPESWNPTERRELTVWRGEGAADEDEPPVLDRGVGASRVLEDAAWLVLGAGLRGEPSALDPSTMTWTAATAEELLRRVQDEPDLSKANFLTKLQRQLEGAPRNVVLLAAELLFLQVIPLSNLKADTKRERIETVLAWLSPQPQLSPQMLDGLNAGGVFDGGVGFNVQIWQQLLWLARFVAHWSSQPTQVRHQGLTDPWVFQRVAAATPQDWPSIRHSLHYLTWPGWTEAVVSSEHRRRIRDAFAYRIDGPSGNDEEAIAKDLHTIRTVLDTEAGTRVEWYLPPYVNQWMKDKDEGQRAWLVRPRQGGAELVARWREAGIVSLVARHLAEVPAGSNLAQVGAAVEAGYQHQDYAQRLALTQEYHAFLSRMKTDDVVVTLAEDRMSVGIVLGEPRYDVDEVTRLNRPVAWVQQSVPSTSFPGCRRSPTWWRASCTSPCRTCKTSLTCSRCVSRSSSTALPGPARPSSLRRWPSTSSVVMIPAGLSSCSSTRRTPTRTSSRATGPRRV